MDRRDFAKVAGGIAMGGLGVGALTRDAEAVSVEVDSLRIPDERIQTSQPVNGVTLALTGSWAWETTTTPTRAVMRVETTYAGERMQLDAWEVPGQLDPKQSGEFDTTANLLDHAEITAPALSPTEIGETKRLTFKTHVTLSVHGNNGKLGEQTITDSATIEVTRRQATLETELSASGEISVQTKTP